MIKSLILILLVGVIILVVLTCCVCYVNSKMWADNIIKSRQQTLKLRLRPAELTVSNEVVAQRLSQIRQATPTPTPSLRQVSPGPQQQLELSDIPAAASSTIVTSPRFQPTMDPQQPSYHLVHVEAAIVPSAPKQEVDDDDPPPPYPGV